MTAERNLGSGSPDSLDKIGRAYIYGTHLWYSLEKREKSGY
jgi:hypothetical protein